MLVHTPNLKRCNKREQIDCVHILVGKIENREFELEHYFVHLLFLCDILF